jgi:hypothetical protein
MMRTLSRAVRGLTVAHSLVIGSIILGGAILAAPTLAPYRLVAGTFGGTKWRLNAVTGEAVR